MVCHCAFVCRVGGDSIAIWFLQEEVLRGKAKVLGTIEELERLTPLLKEALQEERSSLEAAAQNAAEKSARAVAEQEAASKIDALEEVSCSGCRPTPSA